MLHRPICTCRFFSARLKLFFLSCISFLQFNDYLRSCRLPDPPPNAYGGMAYRFSRGAQFLTVYRRRLCAAPATASAMRSEEHTSELQSLMRISYAVFCLKK